MGVACGVCGGVVVVQGGGVVCVVVLCGDCGGCVSVCGGVVWRVWWVCGRVWWCCVVQGQGVAGRGGHIAGHIAGHTKPTASSSSAALRLLIPV